MIEIFSNDIINKITQNKPKKEINMTLFRKKYSNSREDIIYKERLKVSETLVPLHLLLMKGEIYQTKNWHQFLYGGQEMT